jgi:electron transfer flavoprotein beta subunit
MTLKILVCIKAVVKSAMGQTTVRNSDTAELNPFDRPALEAALKLKESVGATITVVSMGPEACAFILNEALAMGVDRCILLNDKAFAGSDTLATASVLSTALKKLSPFDLLLYGNMTSDSDTGHVGPQTSVLLNLPLVTNVHEHEVIDGGMLVKCRCDGYIEKYEISYPCALTISPKAYLPRDLNLVDLETAFNQGKIENWNLKDLGIDPDEIGEHGSLTRVLSMKKVTTKRKCQFMEGTAEEQADQLLVWLDKSGSLG